MSKRKREEPKPLLPQLPSVSQPVLYDETYLSWIPLEVMEDILPFLVQDSWNHEVCFEDATMMYVFTIIARLDASKTLFQEFRQQYVHATCQTVEALQRCFGFFRDQQPKTCFICRSEVSEIFEYTEQYFLLHRFPELMKSKIHGHVIRDGPVYVPICLACYSENKRSSWSVILFEGAVFISFQRRQGSPVFSFKVSSDTVENLDTHGLHVDKFLNEALLKKIRLNQYHGVFPYLSFIFDREHNFGTFVDLL